MPSKPTKRSSTPNPVPQTQAKAAKHHRRATKAATSKPSVSPLGRLRVMDVIVILLTISLVGYGIWRASSGGAAGASKDQASCAQFGREHQVVVAGDRFSPDSVTVNRCDRLVISNQGPETYDLRLGTRDNHLQYPGFDGQLLRTGEYFTFDMVKTGTFPLHDHTRDNAKLNITVSE